MDNEADNSMDDEEDNGFGVGNSMAIGQWPTGTAVPLQVWVGDVHRCIIQRVLLFSSETKPFGNLLERDISLDHLGWIFGKLPNGL